jgi:hypothetical protein
MKYTLKKTETTRKAGKFFYEVMDENGNIISTRSSNREYNACTINGEFFFGRVDLIGKGDHGRMLKYYKGESSVTKEVFQKQYSPWANISFEDYIQNINNKAKELLTIAYL